MVGASGHICYLDAQGRRDAIGAAAVADDARQREEIDNVASAITLGDGLDVAREGVEVQHWGNGFKGIVTNS